MINWKNASVNIAELKDYEFNPRKIADKEIEKLTSHIKEDGYHQRIIVNSDYTIIGGHQRKKALLAAGYKEDEVIDVLISDRLLSAEELERRTDLEKETIAEVRKILTEEFGKEQFEQKVKTTLEKVKENKMKEFDEKMEKLDEVVNTKAAKRQAE